MLPPTEHLAKADKPPLGVCYKKGKSVAAGDHIPGRGEAIYAVASVSCVASGGSRTRGDCLTFQILQTATCLVNLLMTQF